MVQASTVTCQNIHNRLTRQSRAEQGRDKHVSKCTHSDSLDLQEACLLRPLAAHVV